MDAGEREPGSRGAYPTRAEDQIVDCYGFSTCHLIRLDDMDDTLHIDCIWGNMNKIAIFVLFSLALYGCNEESKVQDAVRNNLKDPDSAKFERLFVSKDGTRACVNWNAKNGFGGYGGWSTAELMHDADAWTVVKMEGHDFNCNDEAVAINGRVEIAKKEALKNAFDWIQKSRKLSDAEMRLTYMPKDCRMKAFAYAIKVESIVRAQQMSSGIEEATAEEAKLRSELQEGNCSRS